MTEPDFSKFDHSNADNNEEINDMSVTAPKESSWEMNMGIKWFSRAGIMALLIGFAMALNYSFPYLNQILLPQVKLIIGALLAMGLFIGGSKLLERFQLLGRILQGGGFSLGYLTLFGAFFIPAVQIFPEPHLQSIGWGLLMLYVTGMLTFADKINSKVIAMLSLGFGYYTASYSGSQLPALVSALLLSGGAVVISKRLSWPAISLVGLLGGLFTCLYWHFIGTSFNHPMPGFPMSLLGNNLDQVIFLGLQYFIFHLASLKNEKLSEAITILNALLTYSVFIHIDGESVLGVQGLVESIMAVVYLITFVSVSSKDEQKQSLIKTNLMLTAFFSLLSILAILDAQMVSIAFAAEAFLFGMTSKKHLLSRWFNGLSILFLMMAFVSLLLFNWTVLTPFNLITGVGLVTVIAMMMETMVFRNSELAYRIMLLLVSSLVFLISLIIGLQSYWITLAIVITGFMALMGGFYTQAPRYRWMGLSWIFLAGLRLFTVDLITLETPYKIVLFLVLGVALLASSYGYNQLNQRALNTNETKPLFK